MNHTLESHPNVGESLKWVSEGQKVWAPKTDGHYILCVVTCAAGDHARLQNEKHGFEGWREVRDCFAFRETVH